MDIFEKLRNIQNEITVAKDRFNSFGGYSYRSTEQIFAEVKKLFAKYNVTISIVDELQELGGRVFVKANAILVDIESGLRVTSTGFAEIDLNHKGMSADQATGSASSYARKYALNALLLLDDVKDNDTEEIYKQKEAKKADKKSIENLKSEIKRTRTDEKLILEYYKVEKLEDLLMKECIEAINRLKKKEKVSDGN